MTEAAKKDAELAADRAAEQAASAAAEDGSTPKETEAAATEAAEKEIQRVAPELTDDQVERIAAASGKAAAQETISEMRRIGAIREEEMTGTEPAATPPASETPPDAGAPPPPAGATPAQIEVQQEPPKKLSWAERFVGRK